MPLFVYSLLALGAAPGQGRSHDDHGRRRPVARQRRDEDRPTAHDLRLGVKLDLDSRVSCRDTGEGRGRSRGHGTDGEVGYGPARATLISDCHDLSAGCPNRCW